jgi:hypothetical protein
MLFLVTMSWEGNLTEAGLAHQPARHPDEPVDEYGAARQSGAMAVGRNSG